MGRIEVPLDTGQQFAALQRQVAEQGRRTVPGEARLSQFSTGIVGAHTRVSGSISSIAGATNRAVIDVGATVIPGRTYQVSARCGMWVDGAGDSIANLTICYTDDGTTPTTSSAVLRSITMLVGQFGSVREGVVDVLFPAPETCTTLRCLLGITGNDGARTYGVFSGLTGAVWTPTLWITDQGIPAGAGIDY